MTKAATAVLAAVVMSPSARAPYPGASTTQPTVSKVNPSQGGTMATVRGTAHTGGTPVQIRVRPITLALAALLVAAALALAIALAGNAGNADEQAGFIKSVRVVPSGPIPPTPIERHQQPGLNAPGMRP
jgi:hypothetical protein